TYLDTTSFWGKRGTQPLRGTRASRARAAERNADARLRAAQSPVHRAGRLPRAFLRLAVSLPARASGRRADHGGAGRARAAGLGGHGAGAGGPPVAEGVPADRRRQGKAGRTPRRGRTSGVGRRRVRSSLRV